MSVKVLEWIGIVGGGQLGRMMSLAASNLGLQSHIYAPETWCPAGKVAQKLTVADDLDLAELEKFAADLSATTYEFENVPVETVEFLQKLVPVFPGPQALEVSQDRLNEKHFFRSLNIPTTTFHAIKSATDIEELPSDFAFPSILKTTRFGYDGKGQITVRTKSDLPAAWKQLGENCAILEQRVAFEKEASQIVVRSQTGEILSYDLIETEHKNGVLQKAKIPGNFDTHTKKNAQSYAELVAQKLDYVGILTIEFFVQKDGTLLANEMAPRVHNSGHLTLEACYCGQFEQHIRAIAGLPLGDVSVREPYEMINLFADDGMEIEQHLNNPQHSLTLYGKEKAKIGRKMGHICRPFNEKTSVQ